MFNSLLFMTFNPVDKIEGESASCEEEILIAVGIVANGGETYKASQKNNTGFCLSCGEEIPEERLKIFPHCNCCVKCQEEKDGVDSNRRAIRKYNMPFQNTTPLSSIFKEQDIENEDEDGEEKDPNSDSINKDDLPPDLRYALRTAGD